MYAYSHTDTHNLCNLSPPLDKIINVNVFPRSSNVVSEFVFTFVVIKGTSNERYVKKHLLES